MNREGQKGISDLLEELLEKRGISPEKLSYVTNIPIRFINALLEGNFKKLPAKPYVRGYLIKIAGVLSVDEKIIMDAYRESTEIRSSGGKDKLPINRFAIQKINKNFIIWIAVAFGLLIFLGLRINDIMGTPTLQVNLSENFSTTTNQTLKITGRVSANDKLTINQEIVYANKDGSFEKDITLSPGLNAFEFDVTRFLGREIKISRQVVYEESQPIIPNNQNSNRQNKTQ